MTSITPVARLAAGGVLASVLASVLAGCGRASSVPAPPPHEAVQVWVTTGDRARLLHREADVGLAADGATAGAATLPVLTVSADTTYQRMLGFGAAFTDASTYLIHRKMSAAQREALLQDLFGRDGGIALGFARVPMGASDFSLRHYSYDDLPPGESDPALERFSIDADRADRLPIVRRALAINPDLFLVASPWSPPGWMKTTGSLIGGTLRPDAYDAFAGYFVRFVQAYAAEGVPIRAITVQNEPHFEPGDYPGMRLEPAARAAVIGRHVGPALARAGLSTQIWEWDHNWDQPQSPLAVLADSAARRWVQGVAWHCYAGDVGAQAPVHDAYPEKDAYFTECSGGEWATDFAGNLKFDVGTLVIGAVRNWARAVALWNLALDARGGPHTGGCGNCRGVVTIDTVTGAVTRNAEYYALGHASRFVRPGAVRVASSSRADGLADGLASVAFRNPDGTMVLLVLQGGPAARTFVVRAAGRAFTYSLPEGAVATFVWR